MCLYSFCIRYSDSSIFSKDILYARYWKLENTSHQIAAMVAEAQGGEIKVLPVQEYRRKHREMLMDKVREAKASR
jgi:hypothetical protein